MFDWLIEEEEEDGVNNIDVVVRNNKMSNEEY